jgi:hypothetical protein
MLRYIRRATSGGMTIAYERNISHLSIRMLQSQVRHTFQTILDINGLDGEGCSRKYGGGTEECGMLPGMDRTRGCLACEGDIALATDRDIDWGVHQSMTDTRIPCVSSPKNCAST